MKSLNAISLILTISISFLLQTSSIIVNCPAMYPPSTCIECTY